MIEWRPCVGFENLYEVSNTGLVRRIGKQHGAKFGRIITLIKTPKGYLNATLYLGNGRTHKSIHKLVMAAFVGERPFNLEINHKNGVKTDNRVENLEYITHKENAIHASRNGLRKPLFGEKHPQAKLKNGDIFKIREMYAKKEANQPELGRMYGVSHTIISDIVNRKTWNHLCEIVPAEVAVSV
jgi:hypothetical protein